MSHRLILSRQRFHFSVGIKDQARLEISVTGDANLFSFTGQPGHGEQVSWRLPSINDPYREGQHESKVGCGTDGYGLESRRDPRTSLKPPGDDSAGDGYQSNGSPKL